MKAMPMPAPQRGGTGVWILFDVALHGYVPDDPSPAFAIDFTSLVAADSGRGDALWSPGTAPSFVPDRPNAAR